MKRFLILVGAALTGLLLATTALALSRGGGNGPITKPPKIQATSIYEGGDSGVTLSAPTGTPAVTADQAIQAAEGQLSEDGFAHTTSVQATLADVTDPSQSLSGAL